MKAQDFFTLSLNQIVGINREKIDNHFESFRKNYKHFPQIIASLESEVTDPEGKILT